MQSCFWALHFTFKYYLLALQNTYNIEDPRNLTNLQSGSGKDVRHAHMAYEAKIWRIIKPLTAPRLRLCRK